MSVQGLERQGMPETPMRPKFDWTVNLGHLLILLGLVISGVSVYTATMVRMSTYEHRSSVVEQAQRHQENQSNSILNHLYTLQRDVAVMKDRMDRATTK